ncbi:CPBP family glutamic-type intramembrane protease [Microbacterium chocolatum]|uniref:CPBP family glutamic-type intramembrane protease n=1 Tax=Microbacterium aurantiacum TaxID=162393 RepID=UPI00338E365A
MTTLTNDGRVAYTRPSFALAVAAGAWLLTAALLLWTDDGAGADGAGAGWFWALGDLERQLLALAFVAVPLTAGAVVAARWAGRGAITRVLGIRPWRWSDAALGVGIALVVRAAVEVVEPTTGTLGGPFGASAGVVAVSVLGAVVVAPVVEEVFFRGLMLRALVDASGALGRGLASVVAVAVSTAAFVALHLVTLGPFAPAGLLVGTVGIGIGCGVLALATGRIGGALVAHALFNAIGILLIIL